MEGLALIEQTHLLSYALFGLTHNNSSAASSWLLSMVTHNVVTTAKQQKSTDLPSELALALFSFFHHTDIECARETCRRARYIAHVILSQQLVRIHTLSEQYKSHVRRRHVCSSRVDISSCVGLKNDNNVPRRRVSLSALHHKLQFTWVSKLKIVS